MTVGRVKTLTTFKTGDPDFDRYQDHVKQTLNPVLGNTLLNAADFRWAEAQGADPTKPPTFALQYRSTGTTWSTILTVDSTGQITQPAWIAPTLLNSWVNNAGGYTSPGYIKDSLGFVRLRGAVKNGVIGSPIFQLPSGYRPAAGMQWAITSNNAFGTVQVDSTGNVTPTVGSNVSFFLDGVAFDTRS